MHRLTNFTIKIECLILVRPQTPHSSHKHSLSKHTNMHTYVYNTHTSLYYSNKIFIRFPFKLNLFWAMNSYEWLLICIYVFVYAFNQYILYYYYYCYVCNTLCMCIMCIFIYNTRYEIKESVNWAVFIKMNARYGIWPKKI